MSNDVNVVLLVDDNPDDADLMMRALRMAGFDNTVTWVRDGVEAISYVRTNAPPQLMLLDLKMPKVDGIEVLRELKDHETTRTIPVVVLTSSSQGHDVFQAYHAGANGYVVKPVDVDAFRKTVAVMATYWLAVNLAPRY